MKKFTLMIFCVIAGFLGLGSIVDSVGARFKFDDRALEILRQARQAIGGEEKIKLVKSLTIIGKAVKSSPDHSSASPANFELNLSLPNQFSKTLKSGDDKGLDDKQFSIESDVNVISTIKDGDKKGNFTTQKDDDRVTFKGSVQEDKPETADARSNPRSNELFRTTLGLLLTPPVGADVAYTYTGEETIDGTGCDVIEAKAGSDDIKLYLNKSSHLPMMMKFQSPKQFFVRFKRGEMPDQNFQVTIPDNLKPELGEFQLKFSDYRVVDGVQFPFTWTQTVDGKPDESIAISNYEINPPNIAEKFNNQPVRIFIRKQPQN